MKSKNKTIVTLLLIFLLIPAIGFSQEQISLERTIEIALENNKELKISSLNIERNSKSENTAFNISKTRVYYLDDKTNIGASGGVYETFGVNQTIEFPSIYFARKKANKIKTSMAEINYELAKNDLIRNVSQSYYTIVYLNKKLTHLVYVDSIYHNFSKASKRKFELGDANYLEMITAKSKYKEYSTQLKQLNNDISIAYEKLNGFLQVTTEYTVEQRELEKLSVKQIEMSSHLINEYFTQNTLLQKANKSVKSQQLLPDLDFNYFNSKDAAYNTSFHSFEAGIAVPLFFFGDKSRISTAKIEEDMASELHVESQIQLNSTYNKLLQELEKSETEINYYEESGDLLANEILKTATKSYQNGEIDFFQYIISLENASQIRINYLTNLNEYNQIVLKINFLNL